MLIMKEAVLIIQPQYHRQETGEMFVTQPVRRERLEGRFPWKPLKK
jgi:hypothetical protein